jgi:glycosyltransferase involved in cell wall biosynthesis
VTRISCIIPTAGRPSIEHCLASIVPQLGPQDEVLVIGDVTDGPLLRTEAIVKSFGPQAVYLPAPKTGHSWGHREINFGMSKATGDWFTFNDDDDIWTPGCIESIRDAASKADNRPILFRFLTYHGFLAWTNRNLFVQDQVGGHCIVCPNIPSKLGKWGDHYQGDWTFIEETVNLHGGPVQIIWREEVIAIARPAQDIIDSIMENRKVAS